MTADFDRQKLTELVISFCHVTGILLSIYDRRFHLICSSPGSMCAFCQEVRSHPELAEHCLESDLAALEKCRLSRSLYSYQCHMGLVEVATPIVHEGVILGYLLFGQIRTGDGDEHISERILQSCRDTAAQPLPLLQKIDAIKVCSREYIASLSQIAKMAAAYIWLNDMMRLERETPAEQIAAFIKRNLSGDLSVSCLCRHFAISSTTLYRTVKEQFGCSISGLIQSCRLECACRLLEEGQMVTDVCERVGIADCNYFIRFFKKAKGITPKQYQLKKKSVSVISG